MGGSSESGWAIESIKLPWLGVAHDGAWCHRGKTQDIEVISLKEGVG